MMITEEMMAEDEKSWHARNIIAELGYCGKYIRHRKSITNDDLRFYAYSQMIGAKDGGMVKAMFLFIKRIRLILLMGINMLLSIRKEAVIQQMQQQGKARR